VSDSATFDEDIEPATPPRRRPRHAAEEGYRRALTFSFGAHVLFIILVLVKSLIFPGTSQPYVPTLRVDMVDLPDMLKKDMQNVPLTQDSKAIADAMKNAENDAKKIKPVEIPPVEKTDPDELVLKPKKAAEAPPKKDLMGALDRIKALSKIESESKSERPSHPSATVIKGNKISKGTSLEGDAKEAAQASYYDSLRAKLQENWALPVWIARQNLDAQVRVYIDPYGRVRSYRFMKVSGNEQFDSAIKKALDDSQPFPRPPDDLASSLLVDGILVGFPL